MKSLKSNLLNKNRSKSVFRWFLSRFFASFLSIYKIKMNSMAIHHVYPFENTSDYLSWWDSIVIRFTVVWRQNCMIKKPVGSQVIINLPMFQIYSIKHQNNCSTAMISPLFSTLPQPDSLSSKKSSGEVTAQRFPLQLQDSMGRNVISITQNTTKRQLMSQRNNVFLNNSNPHSPNTQLLVKFMMDKQLTFTGTDSKYFEISKEEVLIAAASSGLLIPTSNQVFEVNQMDRFQNSLPLIVKTDWQVNCNNGAIQNYLVENLEALQVMTQTIIEQCGGAILEQFIPGREIACLCYSDGDGILSFAPVEFCFKKDGAQYINQQLKNDPLRHQWYEQCNDEQIVKQAKRNIESFFRILCLSGQFLFTLRINAEKMYLINYKPITLSLQAGVRPFRTSGLLQSILFHNNLTKKTFLDIMLAAATKRQERRSRKYAIHFSKQKNAAVVYATRTIQAQEEIYQQQNARENIIVIEWLKKHHNRISWGDFWSSKSQGWKPISHSCSPNSIVKLNSLQAVRKINEGEEITVDMATLFYHQLTFQCTCNSSNCRGTIDFKSQREGWFHEIPSAHFHHWMMDYMFKETLISLINAKNPTVKLEYEPGNCYCVAKRDISLGERVIQLKEMPIYEFNTRHSITKGDQQFWDTKASCGQYLNHKCQNYNLRINEDSSAMVAVKKIPRDTMLTFNYLTTEWNVCFPFTCLCGEEKCYRVIKGLKNHDKAVQQEIYNLGHCSQYVGSLYSQQ